MKKTFAWRAMAMLLALAMLLTTASLAEVVLPEEELPEGEADIIIEEEDLALSEDFADVDLELSLDEIALDLDLEEAPEEALSETEEGENAANASEIVLGVKEKHPLNASAIGSGRKVKFKTSNKKVATVSSKGVIKGVKKGKATISCLVSGKTVATYQVKVVPAPKTVKLSKSETLGVKESVTLIPEIPDGTHASYTWSSKNKKIVTVSKTGKVTGKKVGKTSVTVKTQTGAKATIKITVKKKPNSVSLNATSKPLKVGETYQLEATTPSGTSSHITWTSSDESVAKVSSSGKVTGVSAGTAEITAETYNNHQATCVVTVTEKSGNGVKYRALLIGQVNLDGGICARNRGDVIAMSKMLKSVKGPDGGKYAITTEYDLTRNQTLSAIRTTFADADENDVSLFFIATHGDTIYSGSYAGALMMTTEPDLLLKDLASALKAVPGKVIVILESCGAGAAVYANNSSNASGNTGSEKKALYDTYKAETRAFDAAVVRAFSDADTGVVVSNGTGGLSSNTGEFRVENKFYVLAASRYQELSWGNENGSAESSYNFFTLWLTEGIGTSGSMRADVYYGDGNGQTTLNELYSYIADVGNNYPLHADDGVHYQHVQVYPANSNYVLFCR